MMSIEDSKLALQEHWDKQNARVRANTVIVDRETMPIGQLLHITHDRRPVYTPRIGMRQADSEDRTVPRITVSDTLAGCIIGHSMVDAETLAVPYRRSPDFLNGFYIRSLDFDVALKPNAKMVYDQPATNEHWLVGYDQDHQVYTSRVIGQFYVPEITSITKPDKLNDVIMTLRIRVKEALWLTASQQLEPGYYECKFLLNHKTTYKHRVDQIKPISQSEYRNTGGLVHSPLSISNDVVGRWANG